MAVRSSGCAAAALAAAVVVYGLVRGRERRLRREVVSERLMAGCAARDNRALRDQLVVFRERLAREVAPPGAGSVSEAAPVSGVPSPRASALREPSPADPGGAGPCPSVPRFPVSSSSEGGPL